MARVTIRIDDETYDRLCRRALRTGRTLSDVIRPSLRRITEPGEVRELDPQDARLALTAYLLSLTLIDLETRALEGHAKGLAKARALLLRWGVPEDVCALAMDDLEVRHGRSEG
ncbi:ribbon-helix-helix protein, CopG family [Sphingomonas hylomeconis]|uniref:Ribbon-helix-helix protein, CopG family n=1 Tax=Sphingomonas hylomeconis TaxID=1395958 RepID=A0ABV7SSK5_9SPHN|nr:ribbon-helix-helix protein, CopG family [Sphingomonas hylomeconis]